MTTVCVLAFTGLALIFIFRMIMIFKWTKSRSIHYGNAATTFGFAWMWYGELGNSVFLATIAVALVPLAIGIFMWRRQRRKAEEDAERQHLLAADESVQRYQ